MRVATLGLKKKEDFRKCRQIRTVNQEISCYKRFGSIFMKTIKSIYSKKTIMKMTKVALAVQIALYTDAFHQTVMENRNAEV